MKRTKQRMGWLAAALVAVTGVLPARGAAVSQEMAMAAAEAWCAANADGMGGGGTGAVSARSERGADGNLLWHEVTMADGGCAFVAPDDRINPVVAYVPAFEGPLPEGHPLRAMLEADLPRRITVLEAAEGTGRRAVRGAAGADGAETDAVGASATRAASRWAALQSGGNPGRDARAPGVRKAGKAAADTPAVVQRFMEGWATGRLDHWNQNGWNRYGSWEHLYDLYTPEHHPCGCVAAAGAALLQHFGVTQAPVVTNQCRVDGVATNLVTKGRAYDWSLLPETWSSSQPLSEAQMDLLGRVPYDMGVCLGMSYSAEGSGASPADLAWSLRNDFGLADARYVYNVKATHYPKFIYPQLRAGAPVALGLSGERGGHEVLAVGCGEDDAGVVYTRVFMGWGGSSDGWYQLPEVDEFTSLSDVVTMMGTDGRTLALCGRVTTTNGTGAAFEKVRVIGVASAETETDENGYWGVRVQPAAGIVTVSCAGAEASAEIGAAAAVAGGSVGAAALAAALPDEIGLVAGQTDVLTAYASPEAARLAALRQGKLLFLMMGAEWWSYCQELKTHIKELGRAFSDDYVFCYMDKNKNAYGFDDGTFSVIPAWAVIDPRRFDPEDHWESEGILCKTSGYYSASYVDSRLDYGREQWAVLGAAPVSLAVKAPGTLAMPKALAATLRFPDGTECDVTVGVAWTIAAGAGATLSGNMLKPVADASGEVEVHCEGTFWGKTFTTGAIVRAVGGIVLESLEIEGPDLLDLYDEASAQFTAMALFSDGSRAEVEAEWSAETPGWANGLTCSSDGRLSFTRDTYTVHQCVTVTVSAVSTGLSATRDVLVYGPGYVEPVSFVLSQTTFWPGAEVTITPQQVRWWRHGVLEAPTDDLSGVKFAYQLAVWNGGCPWQSGGGKTGFTVPDDAFSTNGLSAAYIRSWPDRERYYDWCEDRKICVWSDTPVDLLAVDFDAAGGTATVARVFRTAGSSVGTLPMAVRPGYLFDGWLAADGGGKVTASTIVSNAFTCTAKWLKVESVDILGPAAATAPATYALAVALEDGTTRTVTNGVTWTQVSGDAATVAGDGTLSPVSGRTGDVELCASAVVGGESWSLCKTVRILDPAAVRSLRIEGPEVIDLYDVPGGCYHAFAGTADGEYEVAPAWSATNTGAKYMQISAQGELSFRYSTYTVYQTATATVTAVCCGLTNTVDTLLYGPGYVKPVSFVLSRNALWPGAEVTITPQQVRWWRHGVLEAPTDDLSEVEFSWELYCWGSGWRSGSDTTFTVPDNAISTNGTAYVYLNAKPARERYYSQYDDDKSCAWSDTPVDLPAVDFDAAGGTATVARVFRTAGSSVGTLPTAVRPGYLFDGWLAADGGGKVTASTIVSNAFTCTAQWLKVESVDILGPAAATEPTSYALAVALEDGTTRTVTNGVAWTQVAGDAATVAGDGTLSPIPGRTGDVELCASAVVGGESWSLCKTVRILDPAAVRSLRIEGPEVIDLYDVPGGRYRAFAGTADGEYEIAAAWSATNTGARYMKISAQGELSFRYPTYTVCQCATATVTAVGCGLTNSVDTLLHGPGYVQPASFVLSRNALWPGAEVELVPLQVQWWRHGVLEAPTDDFSGVEFSWELYCPGSGWHSGSGTTFTVPADAFSTNDMARVYLCAKPARERYYDEYHDYESVHFLGSEPARWVTVTFDANGGGSSQVSALYLPGQPYQFLPEPLKTGYSGTWYTEREGGSRVTTSSNAPTADATLHAHWSPNYYRIVFDGNGAEGTMADQVFYYDRPATLRTNAFTMEGDSFAGWALTPGGEAVFADGAEILNLRDDYDKITLYAVWPKTTYVDIAFDPNGGAVGEKTRRAALGRPLRTLPLPTRAGHAFAGWHTAAEGGGHVRRGMTVPGPATLYAHWVEGSAPGFTEFAITNATAAIEAAQAEDKLLFVLHGADWCGYTGIVKSWLAVRWAEVGGDFVVYYCNGDYDNTINGSYPQYGVFDPAAFSGNWKNGCYAYQIGGSDSLVEALVTAGLKAAGRLGEWPTSDDGFTATTPAPVPHVWLESNAAAILAACGGDHEAAAKAAAANGIPVWACYVAGLDPTDRKADFKITSISFADGELVIEWAPDLNAGGTQADRTYVEEGKASMADEWGPRDADSRFFRVRVSLPE